MFHYIVSVKDNQETFKKFLEPSLPLTDNRVLVVPNTHHYNSMFRKYNHALDTFSDMKDNDVVVFSHDDITIHEDMFEEKVSLYFKYMPNVGMAGVIGTTLFTDKGGWWMCDRRVWTRGKILQGSPGAKSYMMEDRPGMSADLVSVDGCIMFMSGKVAKKYRFDEKTYDGYHFYDVDSCFSLKQQGYDIGIIDILVEHQSEGPLPDSWHDNKNRFYKKWEHLAFPVKESSFYK